MEKAKAASLALTWKDRQRTRVPLVDLDDNPFCVERRTNEEFHMMQLNKNPSLVNLTSADIPRTASFMVDTEKPSRDFSRKKRNLLAWSLRAASASGIAAAAQGNENRKPKPTRRMSRSKTVPSDLGGMDVTDFFTQVPDRRRPPDRADIDIETLPNLEPYRREVVAQQPITFGHRPVSASRMFNPCTMATSCGIPKGGKIRTTGARGAGGRRVGASCTRRSAAGAKQHPHLKSGKGDKRGHHHHRRRSTGLSATMLKALLKGDPQTEGGAAAVVGATAPGCDDSRQEDFDPCGENVARHNGLTKATYLVVDGHEDLSDSSIHSDRLNESMWRTVNPGGGGVRGNLEASWFTTSGAGEIRQGLGGLGGSTEELELQRIFSEERPPWDGTPAPLPAPRNVRRAISSLLMPDPDERLRDKLIKYRKSAAGVPVTASSTKDEREKELHKPSGRWEASPATPRTVIAHEEIRKLEELRRERDSVMAKRVRKAELRVFFNKIAPSEKHYRDTLQVAKTRFQHLGVAAA